MPDPIYDFCPYGSTPYGEYGCDDLANQWHIYTGLGMAGAIVETLTGPVHVNEAVTSTVAAVATLSTVHLWPIASALDQDSAIAWDLIWGTISELTASSAVTLTLALTMLPSDSVTTTSDPRWILKMPISSSLAITAALADGFKRYLPILSVVTTTATPEQQHEFFNAVAAAIVASSLTQFYAAMDVEETVDFSETIVFLVTLVTEALASVALTSAATNGLTILLPIETEMNVVSALLPQHTFADAPTDTVSFVGALNLEDTDYSVWAVNTDLIAASEYEQFPFNSFAFAGRRYLAASADGIYELTGEDDDGVEIEAYIRTGLLDLGTTALKQVIRAYLGYTSSGKLLLKTFTTDGGQKVERWYELTERTADAIREARVKFGKGVKSRYWQFEIKSLEGSDFSIDQLQVLPLMLSRRVKE